MANPLFVIGMGSSQQHKIVIDSSGSLNLYLGSSPSFPNDVRRDYNSYYYPSFYFLGGQPSQPSASESTKPTTPTPTPTPKTEEVKEEKNKDKGGKTIFIIDTHTKEQKNLNPTYNIDAKLNDDFPVELSGCLVCGYEWYLTYDPSEFKHIRTIVECPETLIPGQSCKKSEVFKAIKTGAHNIIGYYYQPWMADKEGKGEPTIWAVNVT